MCVVIVLVIISVCVPFSIQKAILLYGRTISYEQLCLLNLKQSDVIIWILVLLIQGIQSSEKCLC